MKKVTKRNRALSLLLSAAVAFSMMFAGSVETFAASWAIDISSKVFVGQVRNVSVSKSGKTGDISSVKSSSSSIIKVISHGSGSDKWYEIEPLKTGKAKLTVKFRTDSGKSKTLKKTLTVKKYPKQIKSLKVNGKKIDTGKNKYEYSKAGYTKTSAAIKMSVKDGWTIYSVTGTLYDSKAKKSKDIKNVKKKITKGKEISFPKEYDNLNVYINMSKDDLFISYYVNLNRNEKKEVGTWTIRTNGTVFVGQKRTVTVGNNETGKSGKISSAKSSDESIIKVKKKKSGKTKFYQFTPKKAGKVKLTVKFKTTAGKEKTLTKTITVRNYPKQIRSLTVNGKTVDVSKHKYTYKKKYTGTKAKVNIKVKDGWKVYFASANLYNTKNGKKKTVKDALAKVNNGKKISFPKKYNRLYVNIYMSKDDVTINYNITLHR